MTLSNSLVFMFILLISASCQKKQHTTIPLIGREISTLKEIDSLLTVGSFSTVPPYTDSKFSVSIIGKKGNDSLKFVFLTMRKSEISDKILILDTLLINTKRFSKEQLILGSCTLNPAVIGVLILSIYDRYAPQGRNSPVAAWQADTLKRKFVSINTSLLSCESEEDMTEEP